MPNWTRKEWKQHKKDSELESEAVYASWTTMSEEDREGVLATYDKPWHHEYFGAVEKLCHIRDSHGRYFRGYCEWQTIEELREGGWDGLSTFASAAHALDWIKCNKADENPQFLEPYESYQVVPLILEQYCNTLLQKSP
jgi:hypothetical protein